MSKFVDRTNELEFLNKEYNKNESSLVILYGRRRIGKTALIKEFGKEKDIIYFLSTEESEKQNLKEFKNLVAENLNNELLKQLNIEDWESAFKLIVKESKNKKVIVIDEFQYLGKSNQAIPSIFQKIWDEELKDNNIMLILCGSLINMMESQTLSYNSPLYGRRTGQIKLKQIPFKNYRDFFEKELDEKRLIEKYAITGGVPKYIESFGTNKNIFEEIQENVLNKQSYLYEEPMFLLKNEVTDVGSYFSIIKSIAMGNKKLGNIASNLSTNPTNLTKYLETLINLDILEREVPITEEKPEKSKKGQYNIKDNFINFWFKFIYPNKAFIELDENEIVMKKIKQNFIDNFVSYVYEDICRQKLLEQSINDETNTFYDKIGRWWSNNEEIDIVGLDTTGNKIIFGECKYYTNKKMDVDVYFNLKEKAKHVIWKNENRKEKYILFSINGFTKELIELAQKEDSIILKQ